MGRTGRSRTSRRLEVRLDALFFLLIFQKALIPPSVTDLSWVRFVHHPDLLSASSFPTTPACPFTELNFTAPSPLLRTWYTILATAFARLPVDALPVRPAFTTAAIATFESDRIHTGPLGQFRIPSSIPATSPSHTMAPVPSRLAPNLPSDLYQAPPTAPSESLQPSIYTLINPLVALTMASSYAHRGASAVIARSTTGISTFCTRAPGEISPIRGPTLCHHIVHCRMEIPMRPRDAWRLLQASLPHHATQVLLPCRSSHKSSLHPI